MLAGGTALHVGSKFKNGSELMLGDVRNQITVPIRPCFSWAENSPQNLAVIASLPRTTRLTTTLLHYQYSFSYSPQPKISYSHITLERQTSCYPFPWTIEAQYVFY